MLFKRIRRITFLVLVSLILLGIVTALAATNFVPNTRMSEHAYPQTANLIKPPECASLNLINIIVANGFTIGTPESDLILGSSNGELVFGGNGDDCILGGGGDDILLGSANTDVCIGGPGNDSFQFWFFGGCETQIQ